MVSPTLGTSRRKKLPRSSMKRLCPRARQLVWSSKCGPWALREANNSCIIVVANCVYTAPPPSIPF